MAQAGDEGRGQLRKAPVSRSTGFDPEISEWGNPAVVMDSHPLDEYIVLGKLTEGTETS